MRRKRKNNALSLLYKIRVLLVILSFKMSSSDRYYIDILTNIPIYLYQYVGTLLYIIGNIGNVLCIFIFFKKSWRKNVCVFYFNICLLNNTVFINSTLLGSIL